MTDDESTEIRHRYEQPTADAVRAGHLWWAVGSAVVALVLMFVMVYAAVVREF